MYGEMVVKSATTSTSFRKHLDSHNLELNFNEYNLFLESNQADANANFTVFGCV